MLMLDVLKRVNCAPKEVFLNDISNNLNKKKMFVITANLETFMIAKDNDIYAEMLLDRNVTIIPDGIGVVKALKKTNFNVNERIAGIDLMAHLLNEGNKKGSSIFLFGAHVDVLKKLVDTIKITYPNLLLKGFYDGYNNDQDIIMKEAVKVQPDILLLALGIPRQELLIYKYFNQFKKGILVGVGGSFDVISGKKKRAPAIFITLNLEWLYRIIKEPDRINRFIKYNIKFFFELKKELRQ